MSDPLYHPELDSRTNVKREEGCDCPICVLSKYGVFTAEGTPDAARMVGHLKIAEAFLTLYARDIMTDAAVSVAAGELGIVVLGLRVGDNDVGAMVYAVHLLEALKALHTIVNAWEEHGAHVTSRPADEDEVIKWLRRNFEESTND
jgi:hypothetical protein